MFRLLLRLGGLEIGEAAGWIGVGDWKSGTEYWTNWGGGAAKFLAVGKGKRAGKDAGKRKELLTGPS